MAATDTCLMQLRGACMEEVKNAFSTEEHRYASDASGDKPARSRRLCCSGRVRWKTISFSCNNNGYYSLKIGNSD